MLLRGGRVTLDQMERITTREFGGLGGLKSRNTNQNLLGMCSRGGFMWNIHLVGLADYWQLLLLLI